MPMQTKTKEYNDYHKLYRAKNKEKIKAYNNTYQKKYLKDPENVIKRREVMKNYMRKYRAEKKAKAKEAVAKAESVKSV